MEKRVAMAGANIVLLGFSVMFFCFQLLLVVLALIYGFDFIKDNFYVITLTGELVFILLPVIVYACYKKLDIKYVFRLNNPGFIPILLIFLIAVPAYFVALFLNNAAAYFIQLVNELPAQSVPVPQNPGELLVGLLVIALAPAFCEEIMHRGLVLRAYETRGTMKAVFFSGILFGIFHFDLTNLLGPIFLGILIGYYVIRTNSLIAGITAHFLNNSIAEALQYIGRDSNNYSNAISLEELSYLALYGAIGLVLTIVFTALLKKATSKNAGLIKAPISNTAKDIVSIFSHWPLILVIIFYILMTCLLLLV